MAVQQQWQLSGCEAGRLRWDSARRCGWRPCHAARDEMSESGQGSVPKGVDQMSIARESVPVQTREVGSVNRAPAEGGAEFFRPAIVRRGGGESGKRMCEAVGERGENVALAHVCEFACGAFEFGESGVANVWHGVVCPVVAKVVARPCAWMCACARACQSVTGAVAIRRRTIGRLTRKA